ESHGHSRDGCNERALSSSDYGKHESCGIGRAANKFLDACRAAEEGSIAISTTKWMPAADFSGPLNGFLRSATGSPATFSSARGSAASAKAAPLSGGRQMKRPRKITPAGASVTISPESNVEGSMAGLTLRKKKPIIPQSTTWDGELSWLPRRS